MASAIMTQFQEVMSDLVLATHCHSCARTYAVTLRGYCGAHCSKSCWASNEFDLGDDAICPHGGCKMCDPRHNICKTQSMYHRRDDYSKLISIPGWNIPISNILIKKDA